MTVYWKIILLMVFFFIFYKIDLVDFYLFFTNVFIWDFFIMLILNLILFKKKKWLFIEK